MNYVFNDLFKGKYPGARVGCGAVEEASRYLWRRSCQPFMQGIGQNGSGKQQTAARRMNTNKANDGLLPFLFHGYPLTPNAYPPHEHHDQCLFCATQPSHHRTSQLRFCSLIFVDYVLILYDYRMAFSPIFSAVSCTCAPDFLLLRRFNIIGLIRNLPAGFASSASQIC